MKLIALCILAGAAFPQSQPGTIQGIITDPEGGTFPVAFVQLKNTQTSVVSYGADAGAGKYSITPVTAGTYDLSINVPGIKSASVSGGLMEALKNNPDALASLSMLMFQQGFSCQ